MGSPEIQRSVIVQSNNRSVWLMEGEIKSALMGMCLLDEINFLTHASIVWGAMVVAADARRKGEDGAERYTWLLEEEITDALSQEMLIMDGRIRTHGRASRREDVLGGYGTMQELMRQYVQSGEMPVGWARLGIYLFSRT